MKTAKSILNCLKAVVMEFLVPTAFWVVGIFVGMQIGFLSPRPIPQSWQTFSESLLWGGLIYGALLVIGALALMVRKNRNQKKGGTHVT
jgi:nitrate reductase gamma subunit